MTTLSQIQKEKRMPRGQKVQMGVIIAGAGLILALCLNLISYGRSDEGQQKDIMQLRKDVDKHTAQIELIPVIKNDIEYLKKASDRTQLQLQILIERK